jgi:serine/threonine protein kinase
MAVLTSIVLIQKQKKNMRDFFERNGGPTLEKAKTIKIFKKVELRPFITSDNFVGKGNFGEVYKGLLDQTQLVAIKKPINVSVAQNEQFANEVIIQSQVIHKNIVKLIGCCLELDIPMLVYEFVSKGSLDDILHGRTRVPLNLRRRLNIAAESAQGLAYMHSGTTTTVLHGDVKPANILLDDSYVPKISDFGISKLINKDVAQHTDSVIGDMTYMDPVYLQTGLLTDKSDVYSFGVVLLELISRKKATYTDNNSLVRNFVDAYTKDKRVPELFDKEITAASDMELLDCLAGMAVECLNLDVHQRPDMTVLAERLLVLKRSWNRSWN